MLLYENGVEYHRFDLSFIDVGTGEGALGAHAPKILH